MTLRLAAAVPLLLAGCAPLPDLPESAALLEPALSRHTAPAPTDSIVTHQPRRIEALAEWRSLNDAQRPGAGS